MLKGFFNVPKAVNEPVKSYAPGTPERTKVAETYKAMWNSELEVPLYIGSESHNNCIRSAQKMGRHVLGKPGQYFLKSSRIISRAV